MRTESYFKVSDGVELKILDIRPNSYDPAKPPIIFVAGWISLISGWQNVLKVITGGYRTLYVETREKISARLPERKKIDMSIERMAQDVGEIIDGFLDKDQPFYFAGSSLGATVILDYLSLGKRQPKASYLISPICKFAIPVWGIWIIKLSPACLYPPIKAIIKWYLRNFRLDKKNEPEQVAKYEGTLDAAEPERLKVNALTISTYSLWEKLNNIRSRVVLIGAKTDTLHGIEELEKMAKLMPSAKLELMQSNKETHSEKAGMFMVEDIKKNEKP